jgi:hypothetical protein
VKRVWRIFAVLVAPGLFAACAGRFDYVPPASAGTATHSVVVAERQHEVWRRVSASFGGDRFVIDGVDQDAGVITLSYSGDPERYVDCGYISSYVKNVRGERTYRFPAGSASTEYELMTGREIVSVARRMTLDARIAVTLTPIGSTETQISATTRYALSRTLLIRDTQGRSQTIANRIHFTSGRAEAFPGAVVCRPTGALEADVLSVVAP